MLKTAKLTATWGSPPSAEEVLEREEERIIADPALNEPLSAEEAAFAERLLSGRKPEQVVAAYLRLYREQNSAPEILGAVPEPGKRPKTDHAAFGPSTWFSLSLGRKHRAEPRWLLPMLCRNAGLSKSAIGAIRVQYQETFVEIADEAVPTMKQELGKGLALEQGAALTELEGVPDFDASPKGPPAEPRPAQAPADQRKSRSDKQSKPAHKRDQADYIAKPAPKQAKPKVQQPEKTARKLKSKDKRPLDAKPKGQTDGIEPKAKSSAKPGKQQNRDKNVLDTSKSLRTGKARHSSKSKSKVGQPSRRVHGKGGEARPFRKTTKKT
ncbi:DbpA RNA binding domain-containing protein [Primorskyibacter sp. S87]|uniref:DbpA RNA binding domain-containing protein n=1 Tax=Primorskyibacter sp. S87 TaxID=3415126 RepID=UPI003C7AEFE6